jgi:hypothetical protein
VPKAVYGACQPWGGCAAFAGIGERQHYGIAVGFQALFLPFQFIGCCHEHGHTLRTQTTVTDGATSGIAITNVAPWPFVL